MAEPMPEVERVNGHVIAVERFLAECGCGWRQTHLTRENAEADLERHAVEWHAEGYRWVSHNGDGGTTS